MMRLAEFRKEKGLFHPKLYLFTDGDRYALFAGSSNLTYGGFYENFEANVLIEGVLSTDAVDVRELQVLLEKWCGEEFSFAPDNKWLNGYRKDHKRDRDAQRKVGIKTEALEEENFGPNWLQKADWQTYYQEVTKGMKKHHR
jgi:phosphatidylserine/phosphatidylglycerophosphate/cardiolipin synthase-like enzyme